MIKLILNIILFITFTFCNSFSQSNFSGERLKSAVLEYLKTFNGHNYNYELISDIPSFGFESNEIKANLNGGEYIRPGINNLLLEFKNKNEIVKTYTVQIRAKIIKLVPVAVNTLTRNHIIEHNDIIMKSIDIAELNPNDILSTEELIGKQLSKMLQKGSIITKADLVEDVTVKRGEPVRIVVISGAVQISVLGTAMQDASIGSTVRVRRNSNRSKVLQGIVAEDGSVIVSSGGKN